MIRIENLHKSYPVGKDFLHVLKGLDLHIKEGEFISIMGASGSGKSTLLNILGLLDVHDKGKYYLNQQEIKDQDQWNEHDQALHKPTARSGFLFIKALGQVGFYTEGAINWDIAILIGAFGLSLFASQLLSGMGMPANPQQSTANKITPVMITGMFLFFPLPAGVLLYMVIANIFQALQTFLLTREALPDNLQSILDDQRLKNSQPAAASAGGGSSSGRMPFEPKGGNK